MSRAGTETCVKAVVSSSGSCTSSALCAAPWNASPSSWWSRRTRRASTQSETLQAETKHTRRRLLVSEKHDKHTLGAQLSFSAMHVVHVQYLVDAPVAWLQAVLCGGGSLHLQDVGGDGHSGEVDPRAVLLKAHRGVPRREWDATVPWETEGGGQLAWCSLLVHVGVVQAARARVGCVTDCSQHQFKCLCFFFFW